MTESIHKFHFSRLKTIIVGVDMSDESKDLVNEGLELAKIWKAKCVLAHVVPVDPYVEANLAMAQPWEEMTGEKVLEIKKFYALTAGSEPQIEVRFGKPDVEIDILAQKYSDPLVLVGHSNKTWLERIFSGSTAKGLATHSRIPVLIC